MIAMMNKNYCHPFMWKNKQNLPIFAFLFSLIIILGIQTNVFSHSLNNNLSTQEQTIAQNNKEVNITTVKVRDNIYMLMGDGGNIGLSVGDDGALMIDSQFMALSDKIKDAIVKINPQPIRYLINSHYHFDHTDGNINFAASGVTIIAHENVLKQMKVNHEYPLLQMKIQSSPKEALPKITFSDKLDLTWNGSQINAFHLPFAHTDGDVVTYFKEQNVIHTGDLFFNGFYPFIDTTVGGSIDGMIKAIDVIKTLCNDDTLIIPGHGQLGKKQDLIAFQDMLKTVSSRIKMSLAKNMSVEDMIKADILKDLDDKWGKGFLSSEQFIRIANP